MSKKKMYKKMSEKKLKGIKRLALKQLEKIRREISFDKKYGNEKLFDFKHLKRDELRNTIKNVEEAINDRCK